MKEMTMRERVARTLIKAVSGPHAECYWEGWLPAADAAIAEMREPTDVMLFSSEAGDALNDNSQGDVWRAMIDAALTEHL